MVKRVIFGAVANEGVASLTDINAREFFVLAVLAVFVLGLGLWPAPLVDVMNASVDNLADHIMRSARMTRNSPTNPEVPGKPALANAKNAINAANFGMVFTTPP